MDSMILASTDIVCIVSKLMINEIVDDGFYNFLLAVILSFLNPGSEFFYDRS